MISVFLCSLYVFDIFILCLKWETVVFTVKQIIKSIKSEKKVIKSVLVCVFAFLFQAKIKPSLARALLPLKRQRSKGVFIQHQLQYDS